MLHPENCLIQQPFEIQETRTLKFNNLITQTKRIVGRVALAITLVSGITASNELTYPERAAAEELNNYPWSGAIDYSPDEYEWWVDENGNSKADLPGEFMDPRGYYYRNCTSYVAWRIEREFGINVSGWGNATTWDDSAKGKFVVDKVPEPGDIAVWDSVYENDPYGHVAFVESVNTKDSSVNVSEYNYASKGGPGVRNNVHAHHYIDVNGTGVGVNGTPFEAGVNSYSSIDESTEITDDNWVYTKVGGSAWPIKPKNQWTTADSQYWGNDPQKVSTDDIRSHEVGYDQNGRAIGAHAPRDGTTVYVDQGGVNRYYFYEGRAYKLNSEAEMNDLGVANKTQRIPATGDRLNDFLGGTRIILPNGSLYRYADNSRIGQIYIQPDGSLKSFYITDSTMLECIQQTQYRSVKVMPQATQQFVEQGVNVTSEPAGCTFPWHWSLSTPGGEQQFRVDGDGARTPYTKRYYPNLLGIYLNSEGQPDFRKAASLPSIPSGPNMSSPANIFFRNVANNEVFWQGNDGLAHKVNSVDNLSCMGNPPLLPVPPEAFQGGIPLGSPAECSLEGKLVRNTGNNSLWYMQNGQRHYVQNMTIAYGLMGRVATTQGRITDTSDSIVKTYNQGLDAFVPYGSPVFVKYANEPSVWLALPDGTRRHAMSLCGSGPVQWQVITMPDGEFNGHAIGPNWSANTTDCNKIANGQTIS